MTAVPEVQTACRTWGLPDEALSPRLEQLLGLPPDSGKDRFVGLWVHPADLFRPCIDPEITDHECSLELPEGAGRVQVTEEHRSWSRELEGRSYGAGGYPWTRLGYTYDRGRKDGEVGVSEFVIRAGATVEVDFVSPVGGYCR